MGAIKAPWLDLDLTLAPSFLRALLFRENGVYVKVVGWGKGSKIWHKGDSVFFTCSTREAALWSGAWFNPAERLSAVKRSFLGLVRRLVTVYSGLGLAVNPFDAELMIVPVVLSRTTDFERNVVRWCYRLWQRATTIEGIASLDTQSIGSSFQLRQLASALHDFVERVRPLMGGDKWEIRRALVSCRYIGPKVADAYLLFTGVDTSSVPVDAHLLKMSARLGLSKGLRPPVPRLCLRYACPECPSRDKCIRWFFTSSFDEMAGWVQTAFYLHDRMFCRTRRCGECPLNDICLTPVNTKGVRPSRAGAANKEAGRAR